MTCLCHLIYNVERANRVLEFCYLTFNIFINSGEALKKNKKKGERQNNRYYY